MARRLLPAAFVLSAVTGPHPSLARLEPVQVTVIGQTTVDVELQAEHVRDAAAELGISWTGPARVQVGGACPRQRRCGAKGLAWGGEHIWISPPYVDTARVHLHELSHLAAFAHDGHSHGRVWNAIFVRALGLAGTGRHPEANLTMSRAVGSAVLAAGTCPPRSSVVSASSL